MLFDHTYVDDKAIKLDDNLLKQSSSFYDAKIGHHYRSIIAKEPKKIITPPTHMLPVREMARYLPGFFITQKTDGKGNTDDSTFIVFSVKHEFEFISKELCTLKKSDEDINRFYIEASEGANLEEIKEIIEDLVRPDSKSILKPQYQPSLQEEPRRRTSNR